ncbi:MAG: hypothetical protein M3R13_00945 [Armatimonadota bacterium]|nr:hypothetical protein [Armatimonadota bacterium]
MFFKVLSLLVLAAVDNHYQQVRNIVLDELGEQSVFTGRRKSGQDFGSYFLVVGKAERSLDRLMLVVNKAPHDEVENSWEMAAPNLASPPTSSLLSGLPCGERVRVSGGRMGTMMQAMDGIYLVRSHVGYRQGEPAAEQRTADNRIIEGLIRRALARCRGLQAQTASNMNVGGVSVGSVTGPRGERLVDLARYCQALNLQLLTNGPLGTASFSSGGEMVIVPLSAKKIKDGGRWIDSNDISLVKDGKWYVSYAALQDARGQ